MKRAHRGEVLGDQHPAWCFGCAMNDVHLDDALIARTVEALRAHGND